MSANVEGFLKTENQATKTINQRDHIIEPLYLDMEAKVNSSEENNPLTPVGRMFNGKSIFITGASGFIGRVLLAKLLSSYPGIKQIYILMRPKKGVSPDERLQKQVLQVPIFDSIRAKPNGAQLLAKIRVVCGDLAEPWLGLSSLDLDMLISDKSLSIVFHSAATIKFDEPLKVSVKLNLIATRTIIELCRQLPNLISICHVSTAYVNSDIRDDSWIEERLYPMREKPDSLIEMANIMDERLMQNLKPFLVDKRPNTYTYTKALAEHMIAKEASDLPVAIVRPSIVVASWREPLPGWIDNLNGPTGLILAIGKGLLRTLHVHTHCKADIVPVDITVNTMIASSYFAAKQYNKLADWREANTTCEKTMQRPYIIHCNSGDLNPIKWGRIEKEAFPIIRDNPSCQVFRYPFGTFKRNRYQDLALRPIVHLLPALILDMILWLSGRKRFLFNIYGKLHAAVGALSHFTINNYNFRTRNIAIIRDELDPKDREILTMDIENMDWNHFWKNYVLGAR